MDLIDQTLGQLACDIAGATGVLQQHRLDFCCGGAHSLREAARTRGLDPHAIAAQLQALQAQPHDGLDWRARPSGELIDYILARYHQRHREQLPELIRLAERVEQVHGDRLACPRGLGAHLRAMEQELQDHMAKEEQVLFPLLRRDHHGALRGPITVMRMEHDQHGAALEQLAALTDGITLPEGACNTWRALYRGLATLRQDLMEHIHLENNILFVGAPAQAQAA